MIFIRILFVFGFIYSTAQATDNSFPVAETINRNVLIKYDQNWQFWASNTPPPNWTALTALPSSKDPKPFATSKSRESTDRDVFISKSLSRLKTEGHWWGDFPAPFTMRSESKHKKAFKSKEKGRRKRWRKKKRKYSRTELIFNADGSAKGYETGLDTVYFAKEFNVKNPNDIKALQIEAKFNKGILVYLNGVEVVRYNIEKGREGKGFYSEEHMSPDFIRMNIGSSDRWENSWLGIDPGMLKRGQNVIVAMVKKHRSGGNPSMYFDLRLSSYSTYGWLKSPFLQHLRQDGLTVSWETTLPSIGSVIIEDTSTQQQYLAQVDKSAKLFHEIRVRGLQPGKSYRYFVLSERDGVTLTSPAAMFRTSPKGLEPFSFLLYGDSRALVKVHSKLAKMMRIDAKKYGSEFVVHTGDIVNQGFRWEQWQNNFFKPSNPLLQAVPIYPTPGNHEINQKLYYDYFDLPNNESWYHYSYGNADFYSVNSNIPLNSGTKQYKWLEEALAKGDRKWKIVFLHHPPFSCSPSRKPGHRGVRKHLVPLFEKYKVNLVLLGHDHLYGRTRDINGVVYLTSGGGGSSLYSAAADEYNDVCVKAFHYVRMHVNDQRIKWSAIDIDGKLIEDYTLLDNN